MILCNDNIKCIRFVRKIDNNIKIVNTFRDYKFLLLKIHSIAILYTSYILFLNI